jgi:hypothetical protein
MQRDQIVATLDFDGTLTTPDSLREFVGIRPTFRRGLGERAMSRFVVC